MSRFPDAAYLDETARIYGAVEIGEGSSLWPYTVIRAEEHSVRIGRFTNVQDFAMIHVGYESPTVIGDYCSITHRATLHGCTIEDGVLVGIGATVMDGAVIGANSIVAGHAFVVEGTVVPPCSIVMGAPARIAKARNGFIANRLNALLYHRNAQAYARGEHRAWTGPAHESFVRETTESLEAEFARRFRG